MYTYLWFTDQPIEEKLLKADKVRDTIESSVEPMPAWSLLTALVGHKMKFIRQPKEQSIERIEKWILESVVPSLAVLKKTGHWAEVMEAINSAKLSSEQQKLVKATMVNAITQANQKLTINFERPKKKYVETEVQ